MTGGLCGMGLACAERLLAEGAEVVPTELEAADAELVTSTLACASVPRRIAQASGAIRKSIVYRFAFQPATVRTTSK